MLPADEPMRNTADIHYIYKVTVPGHTTRYFADTRIGETINSSVTIQLDERKDAKPDGDIQLDPAIYDNFAATNLSADAITIDGTAYAPTTITIGGTDYTILAAQTEAAL